MSAAKPAPAYGSVDFEPQCLGDALLHASALGGPPVNIVNTQLSRRPDGTKRFERRRPSAV